MAGQVGKEVKHFVLTETAVPAGTEGGNAAMATDSFEKHDHAATSVRAAIIGEGDRIT